MTIQGTKRNPDLPNCVKKKLKELCLKRLLNKREHTTVTNLYKDINQNEKAIDVMWSSYTLIRNQTAL